MCDVDASPWRSSTSRPVVAPPKSRTASFTPSPVTVARLSLTDPSVRCRPRTTRALGGSTEFALYSRAVPLFEPVLEALNARDVRYVVVGGLAVVLHGHARLTADLDIAVDLSPGQAAKATGEQTSGRVGHRSSRGHHGGT